MKSRITKTVALAALMAGSAGVAHAGEGWYGRADIGWSFDGEAEYTDNVFDDDFALGLEHDWTQHLGLGYAFSNGFRVEGEIGHRFNQFSEDDMAAISTNNLPLGLADGDVHAWSAMANLFYDFNKGGGLEPYLGVGVGAARLNARVVDAFSGSTIGDEDTVLA